MYRLPTGQIIQNLPFISLHHDLQITYNNNRVHTYCILLIIHITVTQTCKDICICEDTHLVKSSLFDKRNTHRHLDSVWHWRTSCLMWMLYDSASLRNRLTTIFLINLNANQCKSFGWKSFLFPFLLDK